MKPLKETKYLVFVVAAEKPKTKVISIINKHSEEEIGTIEWYGPWRQYVFIPGMMATVWNDGCLRDIIDVLKILMLAHRSASKEKANNGI